MNTAYTGPGNNQDNEQWKKQQEGSNNSSNPAKKTLENSGPNKDQDFKVLNSDGSLPTLPDQDVPGGGALDGTIGLGT